MNQPSRTRAWTDVAASSPGNRAGNSIIESMGVYLPPKIVATAEVRRACKRPISLPLERLTGIYNRRMVGDDTFSIDLAKYAMAKCLTISKYHPSEIDLLICCNMSRYDGPNFYYTVEPNTSIRLRKHLTFPMHDFSKYACGLPDDTP